MKGQRRKLLDFRISIDRKQADRTTCLQTCVSLQEKGRLSPRAELGWHRGWQGPIQAQRAEHRTTEDYFQALKPKGIYPAGFGTCLGLVTPLFLPISISLLQWECLGCAFPTAVFGKEITCFSRFTGLQIEKNIVREWIMPRVSPIPDLDEIWVFWADNI